MTPTRTIALVAGAALLAAWLAAAAGTGPAIEAEADADPQASADDPVVTEVRAQSARLHAYLARRPPRPEPARNPFEFGDPGSLPSGLASEPIAAPDLPAAELASPPASALIRLIGIAETAGDAGVTRTAVLADDRDTHLVVLGDEVAGYRVSAIGAEAIELRRLDDDRPIVLALP